MDWTSFIFGAVSTLAVEGLFIITIVVIAVAKAIAARTRSTTTHPLFHETNSKD